MLFLTLAFDYDFQHHASEKLPGRTEVSHETASRDGRAIHYFGKGWVRLDYISSVLQNGKTIGGGGRK